MWHVVAYNPLSYLHSLKIRLLSKNGGRGTKLAYIFMVINPSLAFEPNATPNGNPTNDFYWRQKFSSLNVVQRNTTSRPINFHRPKLYSLNGRF